MIELIIVIIILGLIALVALPRFIDTSRDARIASLKSARGAVASGLQLFSAKAAIASNLQPVTTGGGSTFPISVTQYVEINGVKIGVTNNNQAAFSVFEVKQQVNALLELASDFQVVHGTTDLGFYIYLGEDAAFDRCYVRYAPNANPSVIFVSDSC